LLIIGVKAQLTSAIPNPDNLDPPADSNQNVVSCGSVIYKSVFLQHALFCHVHHRSLLFIPIEE